MPTPPALRGWGIGARRSQAPLVGSSSYTASVSQLVYVRLSGNNPPGEERILELKYKPGDEPQPPDTAAAEARAKLEALIRAFDAAGTKVVMATHNLGQARRLGDEVLFLHQGRLVERSPVDRFFSKPASAEAAAFIKGELPWV